MYDNITPGVQWTPGVRHKVKRHSILFISDVSTGALGLSPPYKSTFLMEDIYFLLVKIRVNFLLL